MIQNSLLKQLNRLKLPNKTYRMNRTQRYQLLKFKCLPLGWVQWLPQQLVQACCKASVLQKHRHCELEAQRKCGSRHSDVIAVWSFHATSATVPLLHQESLECKTMLLHSATIK